MNVDSWEMMIPKPEGTGASRGTLRDREGRVHERSDHHSDCFPKNTHRRSLSWFQKPVFLHSDLLANVFMAWDKPGDPLVFLGSASSMEVFINNLPDSFCDFEMVADNSFPYGNEYFVFSPTAQVSNSLSPSHFNSDKTVKQQTSLSLNPSAALVRS